MSIGCWRPPGADVRRWSCTQGSSTRHREARMERRTCPACRHSLPAVFSYCGNCGRDLGPVEREGQETTDERSPEPVVETDSSDPYTVVVSVDFLPGGSRYGDGLPASDELTSAVPAFGPDPGVAAPGVGAPATAGQESREPTRPDVAAEPAVATT